MKALQRFQSILSEINYRDWRIHVRVDGDSCYLQAEFEGVDSLTGKPATQHGRKWLLSPHMTATEVVVTAFKACLTAEEHECREFFRYRGQAVFNLHTDVQWLAAQMAAADVSDARKDKPQ